MSCDQKLLLGKLRFSKPVEVCVGSIGLFFGSDEGNSERIAYRIQKRLGLDVVDVLDIHGEIILCKDKKATSYQRGFISILSIL